MTDTLLIDSANDLELSLQKQLQEKSLVNKNLKQQWVITDREIEIIALGLISNNPGCALVLELKNELKMYHSDYEKNSLVLELIALQLQHSDQELNRTGQQALDILIQNGYH